MGAVVVFVVGGFFGGAWGVVGVVAGLMRWLRRLRRMIWPSPAEIRAAHCEDKGLRQKAAVENAVCLLFGKQCCRVEAKFDRRVGGHYLTVSHQDGTEFDWFPHLPGRRYR